MSKRQRRVKTTVSVRISCALYAGMNHISASTGLPVSRVVNTALAEYLQRVESEGRLVFSISARQPEEAKAS